MKNEDAVKCAEKLRMFFNRRRFTGQDPEDLVQEVLTRVLEAESKGTVIGDLCAFALGIARNLLPGAVRAATSARRQVPIEDAGSIPLASEDSAEKGPGEFCLEECLARLTEKDRAIVTAVDRSGASQSVIAKFKMTTNAVYVAAHRVRKRLSRCIVDCEERNLKGAASACTSNKEAK